MLLIMKAKRILSIGVITISTTAALAGNVMYKEVTTDVFVAFDKITCDVDGTCSKNPNIVCAVWGTNIPFYEIGSSCTIQSTGLFTIK